MNGRIQSEGKHKELRMWFYLSFPTILTGVPLIYFGKQPYQYISLFMFFTVFYTWRYFYRKKQKAIEEDKRKL
ncbi:hypothetical protein NCCP2716_30170 [Sporosarcina sp. NCCP-2716]|nr:hypothetical protein NCCP2716_30170 [Sporosarcina sp. NCCP-2716]